VPLSLGFLSTYPPTRCGLATFTRSLATQLSIGGHRTGVVRVVDQPEEPWVPDGIVPVVRQIAANARGGPAIAAAALSGFDVAVIQHEYGIYGGHDGQEVVDVMELLTVPSIVVAHTVLTEPSPHQREVFERVIGLASIVVTMSETARLRLVEVHDVDPRSVVVIPHGAAGPAERLRAAATETPTMLTWGLIGPGKGIESVIDAMATLQRLHRPPHYHVVGKTHPKVLAHRGEEYRHQLMARSIERRVAPSVTFHGNYLDATELNAMIARADVVVLPYESREQVTSGVLIEAVAAGKPVVATAFPHAVELLASGAGLVVPHGDPAALAAAIRRVLTEPGLAETMSSRASTLAPELAWPAVAGRYGRLADEVVTTGLALAA
jgi:glycosyltransferase involved in cell wall biosynthesis